MPPTRKMVSFRSKLMDKPNKQGSLAASQGRYETCTISNGAYFKEAFSQIHSKK